MSSVSVLSLAEDGEYFLKVLIPSYAAGSIIGKGGQTIVQLQKETGATIKLSKSKDFYPGECGQQKGRCCNCSSEKGAEEARLPRFSGRARAVIFPGDPSKPETEQVVRMCW